MAAPSGEGPSLVLQQNYQWWWESECNASSQERKVNLQLSYSSEGIRFGSLGDYYYGL